MNSVQTGDRYPCTAMEAFFRSPPLLSIEETREYDAMKTKLSNTVKPRDVFEELWIDDYLYYCWQIRRWRKGAADIIDKTHKAALRTVLESVMAVEHQDLRYEIDEHIENWFKGGQFKETVLKFLSKYDIEERHITAQAMELRLSQLGQIERMIGDFERRRSGALREFEFYRIDASWRAPKELPALIDAAADERQGRRGGREQDHGGRGRDCSGRARLRWTRARHERTRARPRWTGARAQRTRVNHGRREQRPQWTKQDPRWPRRCSNVGDRA